ncbi:uncharacterized protein LOC130825927 [Amaranthus tricolor]|uniref:uncharacterized protein LOC130825927 n=1 Tax=Amaranthus tricolor TaxID=29722 RepID=UPI00259079CC|nr:uncharacterized protein LOC130825927 [Amaranthus tricolor]
MASNESEMNSIKHRTIQVNGIKMHVAEKGEEGAPVVLFIHGFPELWYSWRHQILALSALGYRAVAPDMRGYGDTEAPPDPSSYTYFHIVGDLVGLIDELGAHRIFVVGHDWGAVIAWWLCVFRPDKVKALVNLSVAFMPRNPNASMLEMFRAVYGDDFYICRFQEAGDMEGEIEEAGGEAIKVLRLFTRVDDPGSVIIPKGKAFKELPPYPDWLSKDDAAYYNHNFAKSGFTGGLNYYRATTLNWELTSPWTGAQVNVPVKFVVGDLDLTYHFPGVKDYVHQGGMKKDVPNLQEVVVLEGVGHFLQQEKSDVVTKHIYDFIQKF